MVRHDGLADLGVCRQSDTDVQARTGVLCRDGASVLPEGAPGDGQTQSESTRFPGAGHVDPVKLVEDFVQVLLRDTWAAVLYRNPVRTVIQG